MYHLYDSIISCLSVCVIGMVACNRFKKLSVAVLIALIHILMLQTAGAQTCTIRPMSFGYTWQGQQKSVDKFDSSKAMCVYFSQTTTSRTYRISLPAHLSNGTHNIPISFSATDAAFTYVATSTVGPATFNPVNPFVTPNGTRQVYLFLGGSIQVPQNISSGNYQATVTITVAFF